MALKRALEQLSGEGGGAVFDDMSRAPVHCPMEKGPTSEKDYPTTQGEVTKQTL